MVGLLGLGNRQAPSADVRQSGPIASTKPAPEQTFPEFVPDNPSSGFFSLPHWTRRILAVPSARKNLAGLPRADEHSANLRNISPRRLSLEKDLPPTPTPTSLVDTHITSQEQSDQLHNAQVSIAVQHATDIPLQHTHYMDTHHNTPLVLPPSQTTSIVFTSFPSSSTENVLRKSKSTFSLRPDHSSSNGQRARGVSMTQMFIKAKQNPTSPAGGNPIFKSPARKSSFWSRKPSASSSQYLNESPSLPVVNPTPPLRADFITPDSFPRPRSNSFSTGLSRCHSERAIRQPLKARTNTPYTPRSTVSPDKTHVRPVTSPHFPASHYSSTRRPTTADSATPSRSRPLFFRSQQTPSPLSSNEPSAASPTSRSKVGSPNPRPRSSTNPPLLHRLSINLFNPSSSSATKVGTLSNISPVSRSPRPSLSQIPPDALKPRVTETSETFVNRLASLVSKAEIAGILASVEDTIYADSLKLFIERFGFHGDPLDVALRRLLMDVGLPRETQQIDRVIQAFTNRYLSCNPDLFTSQDHPYILAFSLIMLHTDAFNKSNRRKMSKADYMKNTTLPGLIPEVLDCFYDNIVFAPFIFIEDPLDPEGSVDGNLTKPSTSSGLTGPMGNTLLSRPKIDPYYLITNNLLDRLRVNVEGQISLENPFRWDGTGASWDYDEILLCFTKGRVVQIRSVDTRPTTPFFGLSVGAIPASSANSLGCVPETPPPSGPWTIRLAKVAVLNRKDDLLEGGKKPMNRKWRPYSVALTRSQLLLFRDLSWSTTLLSWNNPSRKPIPSTSFKPDEIISLNDALAVLDRSYSKHLNTFRLTTGDGRHILLQTTEETEMNEWISRINYASAFKTTGIRMRSLSMTNEALELTGVAAATSHLHDLQLSCINQPRMLTWDHRNLSDLVDGLPRILRDECCADIEGRQMESADISAPEVEGASQLKETFDTVKAELATTHINARDLWMTEKAYPVGAGSPHLASRSHMINSRVEDLESRICTANAQINSEMHIARNIAILAPFQKSTRDRLHDTIQTMSKKIHAMRLDVTKLICHRNILLRDLSVEEKNFKQATSLALQAATETLHERYSKYTSQSSISSQEYQSKSSFHGGTFSTRSQSFDSPTYETFRTALDFGPDWPSSGEAFVASSLWGAPVATESPITQGCDTGGSQSPDETSYLSFSTTNPSLPDTSCHEKQPVLPDFAEEQAEEWHKTRAAKRVSLVKLPPDLRMTVIAQGNSSLKEEPVTDYRTRCNWTP